MCLSTNFKHLITASVDGIIYIWKLPEPLTKAIEKLRADSLKVTEENEPQTKPAI